MPNLHQADLVKDLRLLLGQDGLLSRRMARFDFRPGQVRMAEKVAEALVTESPTVVEAGTGIGKTIAYLTPLLLTGVKAVISTGTRTLQEQIYRKDIPQLCQALGLTPTVAIMKGRSNYLCRHRFNFVRRSMQATLFGDERWPMVQQWAERTVSGDRAEIPDLPDDYPLWNRIAALPDTCRGGRCAHFRTCFLTRRNREAAKADLIVVNHHLFFADLALREGESKSRVIPDVDAVVFDEAHQLESIATQYFGFQVSSGQLQFLIDDFRRGLEQALAKGAKPPPEVQNAGLKWTGALDRFNALWTDVAREAGGSKQRFHHDHLPLSFAEELDRVRGFLESLDAHCRQMTDQLSHAGLFESDDDDEQGVVAEEFRGLSQRARRYRDDLTTIFEPNAALQQSFVFFWEHTSRRTNWACAPISVADALAQTLHARPGAVVYTSATLSTGDTFDYFLGQLGMAPDVPCLSIESPFYTQDSVLLFAPTDLPEPNTPDFSKALGPAMERIVELVGGGVLGLFTSYANLKTTAEYLRPRLPQPVLVQGDRSAARLLEQFREDADSVLLATGTFWEGVDVMGDSLRCVIIDKLPFDPPNDPFTEARIQHLRRLQQDPFTTYQLPRSILALKQGLGRLLRSPDDSGLWVVLDRRLLTKPYGRTFILRSLPTVPVSNRLDETVHWWQNIRKRSFGDTGPLVDLSQ